MQSGLRLAQAAVLSSAVLAGCANTQSLGLPWIPPGPGISAEEARARAQGTAAAKPAATASPSAASTAGTPPSAAPAATSSATPPIPPASPPTVAPVTAATPAASTGSAPSDAGPANPVRTGTGYTQATRYGDLLFISGQIALDPRTLNVAADASIEEQTRMTMDNLRAVLETNGLTMANLLSTTVYLRSINDLPKMDAVYARAFKGTLPSRTVVEVARLPRGVLLEISAIAGR